MQWRAIFTLIRPEHWVKNLFLFIPAFFAARLLEPMVLSNALVGFLSFSFIASAVYIINDIVDAPQDRNHPDKKDRPIASGSLTAGTGVAIMLALGLMGFALAYWLGLPFLLIGLAYFGINIAYTFSLKHYAIIDVSLIGTGFLLRVYAGAEATDVAVSQWLTVLTFLIALILGLAKRRGEYLIASEDRSFRKALEGYNLAFLDQSMVVCATVSIVAYLMYCFSPEVTQRIGSDKIYFTSFFVIVGILRYLQLTLVFEKTESPVRALLYDRFLQVVLLGWIGSFAWLLYFRNML
ncbi:MAG: UbiA prenyltransferase family protein [Lewinellaceae bacterium]|nr:UbiA prenyltransferase family protein [Lewinellaceae bacterium]